MPELVLNSELVRHLIVQKMQNKSAPEVRRLFLQTVQGWANPPVFLQKFLNSPNRVSAEIWPGQNSQAGKIYSIVNFGSPEHPIVPRRGRMLVFRRGYRAATRPRMLSSRAPSRFGDIVTSRGFRHPGFQAREFDKEIVEQYAETFAEDIQDVIHMAVRRG